MLKSLLYPLLLCTKAILIVMCPLNYVKISVVPFAILIFTLCLQNSGENTGMMIKSTQLPLPQHDLTNLMGVVWAWPTQTSMDLIHIKKLY